MRNFECVKAHLENPQESHNTIISARTRISKEMLSKLSERHVDESKRSPLSSINLAFLIKCSESVHNSFLSFWHSAL